jgi:hypothetical protein
MSDSCLRVGRIRRGVMVARSESLSEKSCVASLDRKARPVYPKKSPRARR